MPSDIIKTEHTDSGRIKIEHIADYTGTEVNGYIKGSIQTLDSDPDAVQHFEEGRVRKILDERTDELDVTSLPDEYKQYMTPYLHEQDERLSGLLGMYLMEFAPSEEVCPRLHIHPFGERVVIITTDNQTSVTVRAREEYEVNNEALTEKSTQFQGSWYYMDYPLPEAEEAFVIPPNTTVAVRIPPNTSHAFLTQGAGKAIAWSVHPVEAYEVRSQAEGEATMGALTTFLEPKDASTQDICALQQDASRRMEAYPESVEKGEYRHKSGLLQTDAPPACPELLDGDKGVAEVTQTETGLYVVRWLYNNS